jgi:recA bacterial DNA recombination protein
MSLKISKDEEQQKKEARFKGFLDAMAEVSKEKDMPAVSLFSNLREEVQTIPTGSLVLDSIIGGGLAKGRIIEIYGEEASGKTSIALTAAGNVQKAGGNVIFIDVEQAFDPKYASKLGVDMEKLGFSQPSFAEDALRQVLLFCKTGMVDLIILDSVAALTPKAEDDDLEKQQMALLARLLSKALRHLITVANQTNTTVIFINQTRANVGQMFGPQTTTSGGKALKFYASQRIQVAKKTQVKDGDTVIGTEVRLKCIKNKIAPPYGEGVTVLTFAKGINKAAEIALIGEELGIIKKTGRTYRYTPTENFGLDENGNILKVNLPEDSKAVYEDDNTIKISSTSQKACIDEIESNLPLQEALGKEIQILIKENVELGKNAD